ncbi:MAG: AbgT family transporter [Verrucomicrobiales bacterium]|nr:AbgT family transporter [Verrucomicrobiales bacterium]
MSDDVIKPGRPRVFDRLLDAIEKVGNKLPDPAVLFLLALGLTWIGSWLLAGTRVEVPKAGGGAELLEVQNQLSGKALVTLLTRMVREFVTFPPLGVVLVAMLGLGVADRSGFISAGLKRLLSFTPRSLLTPMTIAVGLLSLVAVDAGYVLVIPLGGVIFYAAGRHPIAGIAAAFAAVSGGFCANYLPTALDTILAGLTETGARIVNPAYTVNPLCNYGFTIASAVLIILLGWFITDQIVEPRLRRLPVDGDPNDMPKMEALSAREAKALLAGVVTLGVGLVVLVLVCLPGASPFRDADGQLTARGAPLMDSIVPIILLLFISPGIVYGYVAGTFQSHRDVVQAMTRTMNTMGHYLVMAFCAAMFIYAFNTSNLGRLVAVTGANVLSGLGMPSGVTICGLILVCAGVNLLMGSASAKWTLLAPIFVPMLMQLGIAPELTQAAYRIGDSTTNIITPLMPYFPLIVTFTQKYHRGTGIGTLISVMLPYSVGFMVAWTLFLLAFWGLGLPLGLGGVYTYPAG